MPETKIHGQGFKDELYFVKERAREKRLKVIQMIE
jgi:hypothetical protein